MNEQEYYKQLVSDAEVINALLKEGEALNYCGPVKKPRARPNLNFIQRTVSNVVSSNQRKISEIDKRIETEKKKNSHYKGKKQPETCYVRTKDKWSEEEILAHKRAMLACKISFVRALEGISAPEKVGLFDKPSLPKKHVPRKKNQEHRTNPKRSGSESSSSSVIICDNLSDVGTNESCSSVELNGNAKKNRSREGSKSSSSCYSSDLDAKDIPNKQTQRPSKSRSSSSSSSYSDRTRSRHSRSKSMSLCNGSAVREDKSRKCFKRSRKKRESSSASNTDDSDPKKDSSGTVFSSLLVSNSSISKSSSTVICISDSDMESYTPPRYSKDRKRHSSMDLTNKRKYVDKKCKRRCWRKKHKRHSVSSSSTDDEVVDQKCIDKKWKKCCKRKKLRRHSTTHNEDDSNVAIVIIDE
ncbi:unnamed protein product [Acanthoscelides obtectus]|uniref:Uncharacterized protein n=1 Tax=Acanthoscelides obtectus TaxID=200917 RepID=A0A9P0P4N9_ACAOB|nr:unnamed protein product [Acanthoscelides obtectus]CAK1662573.1 hypothetical protein AOBTE_LOCUS23218 [Acanthoscelides obtectus]